MKVILALILIPAIATAGALPIDDEGNPLGWNVPHQDGSFSWMSKDDFKQAQAEFSLWDFDNWSDAVGYYLYTPENAKTPDLIFLDNRSSIEQSHFNPGYPTKFIIHGWGSSADSQFCYDIRDSYLGRGSCNVICVNWSDMADTIDYISSVLHLDGVGRKVAAMIDFLYKSFGMPYETLHVVGHSLGAHISGFAGKNVLYGRINQITGLDPALPLFSYDFPDERLNQNDAAYVETIQTDGGKLGFLRPIGKAAFYPNGGESQPGCSTDYDGACAHGRSFLYFAEAIRSNDFPTVKCTDYEEANSQSCGSTYSSVRMAAPTNFINAIGVFYVPVNAQSPYGKGQSS